MWKQLLENLSTIQQQYSVMRSFQNAAAETSPKISASYAAVE